MSAIEFQCVSKAYGPHTVLSDLSFQLEQGERLTIQGPSGCGKSTVLRLIAGFVAPDSGIVRIGDQDVSANRQIVVEPHERKLGMVFQDLALWPHLTVHQNLDFSLKAQGLSKEVRAQRISEMLERVRLQDSGDVYPGNLSGGQQQRVAIARALVAQPLALLMDEPLSSLDDDLKDELCGHLLDLHAQLGFTLVYVTHSKEEMQRIGTRSIRLVNGKEVAT